MAKNFQKDFLNYCNRQDLEINPNQLEVIKKLEQYYKSNFKGNWEKFFTMGKDTGLYNSGNIHFAIKDIILKNYLQPFHEQVIGLTGSQYNLIELALILWQKFLFFHLQ